MLWFDDRELCRDDKCERLDLVPSLQDRFFARQWLQHSLTDVEKMLELRALLSQDSASWDISRMSDEAVIDQIADLLASKRLHVHPARLRRTFATAEERETTSPAEEFSFVPPPKPKAPVTDTDPLTFPPRTEFAAQAATLVAAAKIGAAGCYICNKS